MTQICMVAPTTDAKAVGATGTCVVDSRGYDSVTITAAPELAGVEEVDIFRVLGASSDIEAADLSGTAYKLTASVRQVNLKGGAVYAVAKDATAGATAVFADLVNN